MRSLLLRFWRWRGRGAARAGRAWLAFPAGVGVGDGEADFLEFGDELAEPFVVVEPGAVVGELVVGQDAGGGPAVLLAGPLVVGAVELRGVGVAAAVRAAAAGHPVGEGAGQGEAGRGEGGDLGGDGGGAGLLAGGGRHVLIVAGGFPFHPFHTVKLLYETCGGRRLYRAVEAVVGLGGGGGVRPGRSHAGGAGGPGPGEEPAVGGREARRLRHRARAGRGAGGAAAPVDRRAVHPVRPGPVGPGAADAADEPAVHRPPRRPAAVSGGPAAAPGTGQEAVQPGGDQRVPRAGRCPAHGGAAHARGRAHLPGGGRRADPR